VKELKWGGVSSCGKRENKRVVKKKERETLDKFLA